MQIARYNKPVLKDKSKKPAILYISLEDDIMNTVKFMYRYLYANENRESPDGTEHDVSNLSTEQLQEYVMSRLSATGFEIILVRGDPGQWTYHDIFGMVNKYEADGYELHACFIDYLAKLPTTGCDTTGPQGTAMRDMFNRMRNFFNAKNIFCLIPHQVSTEAKQLIRNDVPAEAFVKMIAGKGYTEMSKQIDQVVDLELYIHKAKINGKYYLTIQRGKHRGQNVIAEDLMYARLPFPYQAPIYENLNDDSVVVGGSTEEDEGLFAM